MSQRPPITRQALVHAWVAQMIGTVVLCGAVMVLVKTVGAPFSAPNNEWKQWAIFGVLLSGIPALAYMRTFKARLNLDDRLARERGAPDPTARARCCGRSRGRCPLRAADGDGGLGSSSSRRDSWSVRNHGTIALRLSYRPSPDEADSLLHQGRLTVYRSLAALGISFSFASLRCGTGRGARDHDHHLAPSRRASCTTSSVFHSRVDAPAHARARSPIRSSDASQARSESAVSASVDNLSMPGYTNPRKDVEDAIRLFECCRRPVRERSALCFLRSRPFYNCSRISRPEEILRPHAASSQFREEVHLRMPRAVSFCVATCVSSTRC